MSRYSTAAAPGSLNAAVDLAVDQINAAAALAYNAVTSDDPTLTAAQMVNGIVNVSGQTTAQDVTTAAAAALVALIPNVQIGSAFEFTLRNAHTSSGAVTVVAGSGVTLALTTAVPISKTQIYRGIVTAIDTPAVTLYGLLYAPV